MRFLKGSFCAFYANTSVIRMKYLTTVTAHRRVRVAEYHWIRVPPAPPAVAGGAAVPGLDLEGHFVELYDETKDAFERFTLGDLDRMSALEDRDDPQQGVISLLPGRNDVTMFMDNNLPISVQNIQNMINATNVTLHTLLAGIWQNPADVPDNDEFYTTLAGTNLACGTEPPSKSGINLQQVRFLHHYCTFGKIDVHEVCTTFIMVLIFA